MKRLLALPLLLVSLALAAAPVIELKTPSQGDFSSAVATLTNKNMSYAANTFTGFPLQVSHRASLFGDSISQLNISNPTNTTNVYQYCNWFNIANALLGQRLTLINNAGVGGDTTAGMLARINVQVYGAGFGQVTSNQTTAPSNLPGPLVGNPEIVFVMGGTNDIFGSSLSAATVEANLLSIYQTLLNAGVTVVAMTVPAVNVTNGSYTTAQIAVQLAVNDWIRAQVRNTKGMILVDAFAGSIDPNNATTVQGLQTSFYDGFHHPNNVGAWGIATRVQAALTGIVPPLTDLLPTSNLATFATSSSINQLLTNPLLNGSTAVSGTGMTGNGPTPGVPTYTNNGSATTVASVAARSDGFGQNLSLATTTSAAGDGIQVTWPDQHANVVVGATYIAMAEINVTGPSGAALTAANNLYNVSLGIQFYDGTTNYFVRDWYTNLTDTSTTSGDKPYANGSFDVVLRTPPITIPATGTPTLFRPFVLTFAAGAGGEVVSVGRIELLRIS